MKSFNNELDELITTKDYSSSNTEGFDFFKENMIRYSLKTLKSHIRILKTLNQYESSKIETEKLKYMFNLLSEPHPIKGMTGYNQMYKFLALVSDFICYSKFNNKYHGDKPEEIPLVLDNLTDYIDDLFNQSKQRTLDNCLDEEHRLKEERMIEFRSKELTMLDDRVI